MPPPDHAAIPYIDIEKNFYDEHPDVAALPAEAVIDLRNALGLQVTGQNVARVCRGFRTFFLFVQAR